VLGPLLARWPAVGLASAVILLAAGHRGLLHGGGDDLPSTTGTLASQQGKTLRTLWSWSLPDSLFVAMADVSSERARARRHGARAAGWSG
jgi:hypothetical protein